MQHDGRRDTNMRARRAGFKRHEQQDRDHSALKAQLDAVRVELDSIAAAGVQVTPIRVKPFAELFQRIDARITTLSRRNPPRSRKRNRVRRFRAGTDGATPITQARRGEPTRLDGILSSVVRDIVQTIPDNDRRRIAARSFARALTSADAA